MLGSIGRDSGPGVGAFGFNSRADRIADRIQDLVRKDGLFGQNRSENMQEVREIFASLSPAEAQAVFKELSPMDIRGLVNDITRQLGGSSVPHVAREMTVGWKHYRYLRNNPDLLKPLGQMERRVSNGPFYHIPKSRVPGIESKLRNGDIIGIVGRDGRRGYATSHVGLAYRDEDGVLRFMHASAPRNYGKVLVDSRLSAYLNKYSSHSGIMVARPVR